jgi:DNA primase
MEKYELQKLRDLPIEGVAERLGLQVRMHKALCPFHDDHHASLSFSVRRNSFRCFVCGASGGTIDLVMRYLNMSFKEAVRWLTDSPLAPPCEGGEWSHSRLRTIDSPPSQGGAGGESASRYERFFERPWLNEEARRFLFDERRLDERVVRWCRLTSWRDKRGVPWLQIPYYDREGRLVGVQNRNLVKGALPRFRFPQGAECGIYNLPVLNRLQPHDELWITEGCSDCWAMLSAGHKAIAIPSATLLSQKDKELLLSLSLALSFNMYPDRDAPGERLFLQLQEVLPNMVHHQLPPDCKDYSDYYLMKVVG